MLCGHINGLLDGHQSSMRADGDDTALLMLDPRLLSVAAAMISSRSLSDFHLTS